MKYGKFGTPPFTDEIDFELSGSLGIARKRKQIAFLKAILQYKEYICAIEHLLFISMNDHVRLNELQQSPYLHEYLQLLPLQSAIAKSHDDVDEHWKKLNLHHNIIKKKYEILCTDGSILGLNVQDGLRSAIMRNYI